VLLWARRRAIMLDARTTIPMPYWHASAQDVCSCAPPSACLSCTVGNGCTRQGCRPEGQGHAGRPSRWCCSSELLLPGMRT
jgi:hypothetical protein